jgi:hypothetical protein
MLERKPGRLVNETSKRLNNHAAKERKRGYPQKQAVAIALSSARKSAKAAGKSAAVRKLTEK